MDNCLGDFLQSRRGRLRPEDVGITPLDGRRRVPGLRREELAQAAGVSVDYYIRLEQGRARNVSDAVLESLARALRLDVTESRYLFQLARPHRSHPKGRHPVLDDRPIREGLQRLLDSMPDVPAVVVDHVLSVRAANRLGRAVFGMSPALYDGGRDLARRLFLEPESRDRLPDWAEEAKAAVAFLRLQAGEGRGDKQMAALIGELSLKSEEFRKLWADHDVRTRCHRTLRMHNTIVGELTLNHETLGLPDDPDLSLHVFAAPDGPNADRLALLASWISRPQPDQARVTRDA